MKNIIEETRSLINNFTVNEANLASTIECLAEQLKNLKEFSCRRYVEETYPELKGDEYVHQVSLLVSESLTLDDPLKKLIHSAQNKYLEQLSSDLDKVDFPYEMQKSVVVKDSALMKITLPNKDYNIKLNISFIPYERYLTFSLSYEMNKRDASLEKKVSEFCYSYEPKGRKKLLNIFPVITLKKGVDSVVKLLNDIHSKLV